MAAVWFGLRGPLNANQSATSIANLKDVVIHGSKRHLEKPPIWSPGSIGSSELLNPITYEVVFKNSTCELKISAGYGFQEVGGSVGGGGDVSNFWGVLKPGTPVPRRFHVGRGYGRSGITGSPIRRTPCGLSRGSPGFGAVSTRPRSSFSSDSHGSLRCHDCGEHFVRWEAAEEHHLSKHTVTELTEGDSTRKFVEKICQASSSRTEIQRDGIERILKVHNMQKTVAQFEEYRELVKIKASKLSKKHPRCLADGNELLRFHGSTLECSLGSKGCYSLCTSGNCRVCRIIRDGSSSKEEVSGGIRVFTASTSGKVSEAIEVFDENPSLRKALIVCRAIGGRVHRPLENASNQGLIHWPGK